MPKQLISSILIGMVCGVYLSIPWSAHADIAVIVHRDNPVQSMTARQVSDIYLGRTRAFESGVLMNIYELPVDSPLREKFFHGLNGMNLKQLNAYWARLRFSGEVLPPVSLQDSRALINAVRRDQNAIAYIDTAVLDDSVRVLFLVK